VKTRYSSTAGTGRTGRGCGPLILTDGSGLPKCPKSSEPIRLAVIQGGAQPLPRRQAGVTHSRFISRLQRPRARGGAFGRSRRAAWEPARPQRSMLKAAQADRHLKWCFPCCSTAGISRRAPYGIAGGIRVVICNTMSQRRLSAGEYAQRRSECEQGAALLGGERSVGYVTPGMLGGRRHELPERVARRCDFIVAVVLARAESMARALRRGRPAGMAPGAAARNSRSRGQGRFTRFSSPADGIHDDGHACGTGSESAPGQAGSGIPGGAWSPLVEAASTSAFRARRL